MANWITLQVDIENLTPGKFHKLYVDINGGTLLWKEYPSYSQPKKQEFTDTRYIKVDYSASIPLDVEINETIYDEGGVLKCNLTEMKKSIREEGDNKKIILESNKNITGFLIIRS